MDEEPRHLPPGSPHLRGEVPSRFYGLILALIDPEPTALDLGPEFSHDLRRAGFVLVGLGLGKYKDGARWQAWGLYLAMELCLVVGPPLVSLPECMVKDLIILNIAEAPKIRLRVLRHYDLRGDLSLWLDLLLVLTIHW